MLLAHAELQQPLTLTSLRKDIFRIIDAVLDSGQPLELERNGRRLMIVPVDKPQGKLDRLVPESLIVGDPEELVDLEVAEWHGLDQL